MRHAPALSQSARPRKERLKSRLLYIYGIDQFGNLSCEAQSKTDPKKFYRLIVKPSDGRVHCHCAWGRYHANRTRPTLYSGTVCSHVEVWRERLQMEVKEIGQ